MLAPKRLAALLADLDSDVFATRQEKHATCSSIWGRWCSARSAKVLRGRRVPGGPAAHEDVLDKVKVRWFPRRCCKGASSKFWNMAPRPRPRNCCKPKRGGGAGVAADPQCQSCPRPHRQTSLTLTSPHFSIIHNKFDTTLADRTVLPRTCGHWGGTFIPRHASASVMLTRQPGTRLERGAYNRCSTARDTSKTRMSTARLPRGRHS